MHKSVYIVGLVTSRCVTYVCYKFEHLGVREQVDSKLEDGESNQLDAESGEDTEC